MASSREDVRRRLCSVEQEEVAVPKDSRDTSLPFLREHAPLVGILSKIPARVHRGVVGYNLSLTAVASHPRFIALGTNAGLVYWYDRREDVLHRLWCADRRTEVTRLAIVETVEILVAVGNAQGCITVFQIPRPVDHRIPSVLRRASVTSSSTPEEEQQQQKPATAITGAEFFTVQSAHLSSPVTALHWSKNGMRLFSGDSTGQVSLTEIDLVGRTTVSRVLCKEAAGAAVVQLSYSKPTLAVSSTARTVLLDVNAMQPVPRVVGSRPRKYLGAFGAVFQREQSAGKRPSLIAVRPRNTLYVCAGGGPDVTATVLLASLLDRPHPDVPLVNPAIFSRNVTSEATEESAGGDIKMVRPTAFGAKGAGGDVFAACNESTIHFIRPAVPDVVSSCSGLRGVVDFSLTSESGVDASKADFSEELFVLEGPRSLVRIAVDADKFCQKSDQLTANPLGTEETEGVGLESVVAVSSNVVSKLPGTLSILGEKLGIISGLPASAAPGSGDAAVAAAMSENVMGRAVEATEAGNDALKFQEIGDDPKSHSNDEVVVASSGSWSQRAEQKDPSPLTDIDDDEEDNPAITSCGNLRLELDFNSPDGDADDAETEEQKEDRLMQKLNLQEWLGFGKKKEEEKKEEKQEERLPSEMLELPSSPMTGTASEDIEEVIIVSEPEKWPEEDHWVRYALPEDCCIRDVSFAGPSALTVTGGENQRVRICDADGNVHCADVVESGKLSLRKEAFRALQICSSPNGALAWRVSGFGAVYASVDPLAVDIRSSGSKQVAVNDHTAFVLGTDGVLTSYRDVGTTAASFVERASVVSCSEGMFGFVVATNGLLVGVTEAGEMVGRLGMSAFNKAGTGWAKIASFREAAVRSVDLTEYNNGFHSVYRVVVVTSDDGVFFVQATKDDLLFKPDVAWAEVLVAQLTRPSASTSDGCLRANFGRDGSLWLCRRGDRFLWRNATAVESVRWRRLNLERPGQRVRDVVASGLRRHDGVLWATLFPSKPGRYEDMLYNSKLHDGRLHPMRLPTHLLKGPVTCVAANDTGACWILTADGDTFILCEKAKWSKLDLTQLGDETRLVHVSLGSDVAWAADADGRVWMRLGDVSAPVDKESGAVPVWIPVESASPEVSVAFCKVAASPALHSAWAVGRDGKVYARLGIYADFRLGVDWAAVPGVDGDAVDVSASDDAVYALTADGRVFRRCGVGVEDHLGTHWRPVPTESAVTSLSSSACDHVYGVDSSGHLCAAVREVVGLSREGSLASATASPRRWLSAPRVASESEEDGWAVVE